jgi:hypothetical protein
MTTEQIQIARRFDNLLWMKLCHGLFLYPEDELFIANGEQDFLIGLALIEFDRLDII